MTRYSIEPRDRTISKVIDILSFAKIFSKNIGENIRKPQAINTARNFLLMLNISYSGLETNSKRAIQKTAINYWQ